VVHSISILRSECANEMRASRALVLLNVVAFHHTQQGQEPLVARGKARTDLPVVTITPDDMPHVFRGVTRSRAFEAMRRGELRAKKAGKATIIEIEEGKRWIRSLPDRRPARTAS
jgi:hypothetical protein